MTAEFDAFFENSRPAAAPARHASRSTPNARARLARGVSFDKDRLVDNIYAAGADASCWDRVVAELGRVFCGHAAIYERSNPNPEIRRIWATDLDPAFVRSFNGDDNPHDIWATSPLHTASCHVVAGRVSPQGDLDPAKSDVAWLQPRGFRHAATVPLLARDSGTLHLGLVREGRLGAYSSGELRLLKTLLPHLRRAIEIGMRLEEAALARQGFLDAMKAAGQCLMVVSRSSEIRFASVEAERLMQERVAIANWAGRLCGVGRTDAAKLRQAIDKATRAEPSPEASLLVLTGSSHAGRYSVSVTPLREQRTGLFHEKGVCVVVLAKPRDVGAPSAEALATLFGLTPAEARLAHALSKGASLADYAEANNVSITTVKTHLGALFSKAGVNRQTDLVRLIFADPIFSRSVSGPADE